MFIRKKQTPKGSISVSVIDKSSGKYKVLKSFGSPADPEKVALLCCQARHYIQITKRQSSLFPSSSDSDIEGFLSTLTNAQVQVIGPELVFGSLYDSIGFGRIGEEMFRHLVIARLAYPGSKLKTSDYLLRYQGRTVPVNSIYRFMDRLNDKHKTQVEQISYAHTLSVLKGKVSIVFYDMTTLYFETSQEDDLRKTEFSKDGKHQHPQIYIGLLVGRNGWPIGYDIFEGNIYEGHSLIPALENFEKKFTLNKPTVVADAGLLSNDNIKRQEEHGYRYIPGARPKNESGNIKKQILGLTRKDGACKTIRKNKGQRLIITYSEKRAAKDEHNRKRGLARLEKQHKAGKLSKSHINNRGYNKYLSLEGTVDVSIDYDKFTADKQWDGIKGYLTNSKLSATKVVENYGCLWHIERAFRISKTDLRIRPVFHRLRRRIEAHICIAFTAYTVYKELERILKKEKSTLTAERANWLTHNIYKIDVVLPESKAQKSVLLNMDEEQQQLINLIRKNA